MKSKKIIALGLVAAMTIAMVTGCGGKKSESSNKTVTSQSEADEMVIGMNSDIIACDPAFAYVTIRMQLLIRLRKDYWHMIRIIN